MAGKQLLGASSRDAPAAAIATPESATERVPAAKAAGAVGVERALQQPASPREAAAQFLSTLSGPKVPDTMSDGVFKSHIVAAAAQTDGSAKELMDSARAKLGSVPFYASIRLTIDDMSVGEELAGGEDGLRQFGVRFKGRVVVKAAGVVVKNSSRDETGTIGVDPRSLSVMSFKLPVFEKIQTMDIGAITASPPAGNG